MGREQGFTRQGAKPCSQAFAITTPTGHTPDQWIREKWRRIVGTITSDKIASLRSLPRRTMSDLATADFARIVAASNWRSIRAAARRVAAAGFWLSVSMVKRLVAGVLDVCGLPPQACAAEYTARKRPVAMAKSAGSVRVLWAVCGPVSGPLRKPYALREGI